MLKKDADGEIARMRNRSFELSHRPTTIDEAIGACASYLSGTRAYYEWRMTENLRSRELKKLNLSDFRTKKARQIRDSCLQDRTIGFVHQAFRYRGKANYRDALFLTYEVQVGAVLDGFIADMEFVLKAFLAAAGAYCLQRVVNADWPAFIKDLNDHLKLGVMPKDVWS